MTAHFTKLRHRNCTALETPHTAVKPPRKSVAIITPIGFAPMGESAANKRPVWRICPPPVCGFELLLRSLKSRFRLKYRSQNISKKNRGSRKNSHFNDIKHAPYKLTHLIGSGPSLFSSFTNLKRRCDKLPRPRLSTPEMQATWCCLAWRQSGSRYSWLAQTTTMSLIGPTWAT